MSTCIAAQANLWKGKLRPGDVLVSNHPDIGGTHLPDITVISPAFSEQSGEIIFYVASRAHHADIGGILPGSVPPNSKNCMKKAPQFFRVDCQKEPAKYPGCSGSRRISDNISDLKAQIAANNKGIQLIAKLMNENGHEAIVKYMKAIQDNASENIRKMLKELTQHFGKNVFYGVKT
ncbi:ANL_HP_G0102410.mRNA.1.CDS.1 [Saccharomyces cerevisiae]|nr:ANL_HP_G0102410.mRNA.1.CDS.1 [Saccharomyces cerevisiae]CAI6971016.1 ANL_HP_G0102410.mRNA.1.CDS.1 [Saccharomyces cerevisiae]